MCNDTWQERAERTLFLHMFRRYENKGLNKQQRLLMGGTSDRRGESLKRSDTMKYTLQPSCSEPSSVRVSARPVKVYRAPTLKKLGDFQTMTRTGMVMMGPQDLYTNAFWIS